MRSKYNIKNCFFILVLLSSFQTSGSQTIDHWETVIMASDNWKYFLGNDEPPADWISIDFDDSSWLTGIGGVGYGDGDDGTVISNVPSVYLRKNFDLPDTSVIFLAILNIDFDDGFVAYINGHEIARENIGTPGIRPLYNEFALLTTYEAQIPFGGVPARFILDSDTLSKYMNQGNNVLSIQVHNCNSTSSDLSSSAWLSLGIGDNSYNYRETPSWFKDLLTEASNLPLLVIDTWGQTIVNEPKIKARLKVIDRGPFELNYFIQEGTDYDGFIGIEVRGHSSQMFPKKSYGFETWDSEGENLSVSLLGMPEDEDWILHGPYSDKSLLRNAITFHMGSRMGRWQPRFKFCEVYLNSNYIGIYMLEEKIKRGTDRVDINKLKADETSGDDLTGGYIIKVDKIDDLTSDEYFRTYPVHRYITARNYDFTYVYPKFDDIVPEQKTYIKNFLTDMEDNLNGSFFKDTVYGYIRYLDINSFVDFQIMQELTNNVDGYRWSTFFYKERDSDGGKLHAGPLWDFDLCYGNVNYSEKNLATDKWLYPNFGPDNNFPMHWWARLMEDNVYSSRLVARWKELRNGPFMTDSVMTYIDNTLEYLGPAIDRNFAKWPVIGEYIWPNYFIGDTFEQEIYYLKNWITDRLSFMDGFIVAASRYNVVASKELLVIYPNPVIQDLNLRFYLNNTAEVYIEIYDLFGKRIFSSVYTPQYIGYHDFGINIPDVFAGYYLVNLRQGGSVIGIQKFMVTGD